MPNPVPKFIPGDIILSSNKSWLSKTIRFFEKLQTGSAEYSHVAFVLDGVHVVEALTRVRINYIEEFLDRVIEIWRVPLDETDQQSFKDSMMLLAGNEYGWFEIPLFALDGVCSAVSRLFGRKDPVFFFTKRAGIFNIQVCSQLGVYGFNKFTKYRFLDADHKEVPWRTVSPDYFQDLLRLPHNHAQLIFKQNAL